MVTKQPRLGPGRFQWNAGGWFGAQLGSSVERARKMVQDGVGNEKGEFYDWNQGKKSSLDVPAGLYLN